MKTAIGQAIDDDEHLPAGDALSLTSPLLTGAAACA